MDSPPDAACIQISKGPEGDVSTILSSQPKEVRRARFNRGSAILQARL